MRVSWVFTISSLCMNLVLGLMLYRAHHPTPLPNTRDGSLVIKYSIYYVEYDAENSPVEVTFVVGRDVWETNGKTKPVSFTFPYSAYQQDFTLPIGTFVVKGGKVLAGANLAAWPQFGTL